MLRGVQVYNQEEEGKMKFILSLAVSAVAAAIHDWIARIEEAAFKAVSSAQAKAWEHGLAAEHEALDRAQSELAAAQQRFILASAKAKAMLRQQPERMDELREKVFGS